LVKVGILSDTHFGFSWGTAREDESFSQAADAIEKLLKEGVDFIILAGDVFHVPAPPPEIWSRAIDVLSIAKRQESNLKAARSSKPVSRLCLQGTPIVAIHGTHERRARKADTALETLEKVGLVIHLHADTITFEKDGERIAVHGLSGVPEKYTRDALKDWSPKLVPGARNILVLHQNIFPFVYSKDESAGIQLADLPEGFDLYIDGHIHTPILTNYGESPVIISGSTVLTQMKKGEQGEKFCWLYDGKVRQIPISTRPFFYVEVKADNDTPTELQKKIDDMVLKFPKDSLVKIKITGRLKAGYTSADLSFSPKSQAIISIDRDFETEESLPESRPLTETAVSLLSSKLREMGFKSSVDISRLYDLLVEGRLDEAAKLVEEGT